MSTEVKRMKEEGRERSALSGEAVAPARHSGAGRNPVGLASPQQDSSSVGSSVWKELRLDKAVEIIRGITFPSGAKAKVPSNDSIACLRTTNVQREVEWGDLWHVAKSFVKRDSQFVRERDILISNANSYELVGKVAFVRNIPTPATLGTFITLFRTRSGNDSGFIYFQLSSPEVQAAIRSMASTTTNISNISTAKLAQVVLRFPPLSKQREIVAEIEKQFTRLDAGVIALRRVQANLKRYRAAVLKAACEGRLVPTEAELAKAEGRRYETGEQLLARILADRRKNWQGHGKYKEPAAPDITNLPLLPEGWAWAACTQIGEAVTGFTPPKINPEFFGGDVPFFKPTDLDAGYNVREFRDSLTEAGAQHGRVLPPLSVLVTCIGATIGKTGLARVRCATNQQINALVVPNKSVSPKYVYLYFCGPFGQRQILDNASATTLPILNKSRFEALPIPLPPLTEQTRIVADVERRLSVIEELEAAVAANLQRATRLRQSILQRAFIGPGREAISTIVDRVND